MKSKTIFFFVLLISIAQGCKNIPSGDKELAINQSHHVEEFHSYANFEELSIKHLYLHLDVSFDSSILKGFAEWEIKPESGCERLVLDTRDLTIQSVTVNGEPTSFILGEENSLYGQALFIPIDTQAKKVRIYYSTQPQSAALQWLKPEQTAGGKHPFLYSQSQAILARSWVPCMDLPAVRFTYSARISVPEYALALMSASNPTAKNDSNTYHFKMEEPIPSYLLALSAGDLKFEALDGSDKVGVYAEPATLDKSVKEFSTLPAMVDAAEALYGAYRWGRYDVLVLPPSFPFGGMENPRLTFATPTILAGDGSLVSLLAHELAHSWSGNLVTNRTWNDFWLNEGFTVYFEQRIMEKVYGKDYADMLTVLGYGDLKSTLEEMGDTSVDTELYLNLDGRDPDDGMSDIAYEKGRFFLRHIEEVLGRERFDEFLNVYFSANSFKTVTTDIFLASLKEFVNSDSAVWSKIDANSWVYSPGLPAYFKAPVSTAFERVDFLRPYIYEGDQKAIDFSKQWSSHEFLRFIRGIEVQKDTVLLSKLNQIYGFNESGNSEIASAWYKLSIQSNYPGIEPELKEFLHRVGRRKFLKPLYEAMLKSDYFKPLALQWYPENRPGYHTVSVQTLDELLSYHP